MTVQQTITAHVQHAADAYRELQGSTRNFSLRTAYENTLCAEADADLEQACPSIWDVITAALDTVPWDQVARDAGLYHLIADDAGDPIVWEPTGEVVRT